MTLSLQNSAEAFLALGLVNTLTPRQKKVLLERFANQPLALWDWALEKDGGASKTSEPIKAMKIKLQGMNGDQFAREREAFARHDALILTWDHPCFPERLKQLADPPIFLALKGRASQEVFCSEKKTVAFVGSRRMSLYGQMMTQSLAGPLAKLGVSVVSGGALGIDAEAHRAALAGQGQTWCVLGHGFDHVYPSVHAGLFADIVQNGCLISEYGCAQSAQKYFFPQRNRLIAGLSQGVVVVEAQEKSGSLITAAFAMEQGREVMAVPGSAQSIGSWGTHALIRQGAHLVTTPDDIIDVMGWERKKIELARLPEKATQVLHAISDRTVLAEDLMKILRWPLSEISGILLDLENKEYILRGPQGRIIRSMQGSRALWQKP